MRLKLFIPLKIMFLLVGLLFTAKSFAVDGLLGAEVENGNVVFVWHSNSADSPGIYSNLFNSSAGVWVGVTALTTSSMAYSPNVAVCANGGDMLAIAAWIDIVNEETAVYVATLPSVESNWTAPVRISSAVENVLQICSLGVGPGAEFMAIWQSIDGSGKQVIYSSGASVASSESWSSPTIVVKVN